MSIKINLLFFSLFSLMVLEIFSQFFIFMCIYLYIYKEEEQNREKENKSKGIYLFI